MSYGITFEQSNKADLFLTVSAEDAETGEVIDFTGADISVTLEDASCRKLTGSTDDGHITFITGTQLQIHFTPDEIKTLRVGAGKIGAVYEKNGETNQLLIGDFTIYDGIASL